MYRCVCGKEFDKGNCFFGHKSHCIIYQRSIGKEQEFLNKQRAISQKYSQICKEKRELKQTQEQNKIRICKCCQKEYTWNISDIKSKDFCSRSCANTRILTPQIRQKISETYKKTNRKNFYVAMKLAQNKRQELYNENPKLCEICGKSLDYTHRHHKTCSVQCKIELIRQKSLQQKYHGHGKQGWYKGFWCDSTWELVYVIYCLDHGINIKRNTKTYPYEYNGKIHKYLPDFIVDQKIVEIKGYHTDLVDIKAKAVNDLSLVILYEKDMKIYFDWVKDHYTYTQLKDLYDPCPVV